ncbi:holo-ACP synthase [Peterkaempfera bronchialis]|uniref:holo-ACP synthase n=1 Tax=Peterkaempfera bronchialis TaxID=2126346 RepID=UPI0013B3C48A|nr:holo-ACP synthase [Peterkaempfera bronchialis]
MPDADADAEAAEGQSLRAMLAGLVGADPGGPLEPLVGLDLVHVPRVRRLVEQHGPRWLADHFSERERAELSVVRGGRAATVAGRLAAKEAFIKLLAPTDRLVLTRDIEVLRAPGGTPVAHPRASALRELRRRGVGRWSLSITHEGDWAVAVAVGCRPAPPLSPPSP